MSRTLLSLAGFQVILSVRFWAIAEDNALTNGTAGPQEVKMWLAKNAIPLKSIRAGSGFTDLKPLESILKRCRVVGLGEETHGTHEFFQVRHRMVEFLVKDMGFHALIVEASYSRAASIDDYLMGRTNDVTKALDDLGYWIWNTEEFRDMLKWVRDYNATVDVSRKVRFFGMDPQGNAPAKPRSRTSCVIFARLRRTV